MAFISDDDKRDTINKLLEEHGSYKILGKIPKTHLDDVYNLFTREIIPDKSSDPTILAYIGMYYDSIIRDSEKSKKYFTKAIKNGCIYSPWNLAMMYYVELEILNVAAGNMYANGDARDKYIKYLKLSLNVGSKLKVCCTLLDIRLDLPLEQKYNIIITGSKNKCGFCTIKLAEIFFERKCYEESLYLCNILLQRKNLRDVNYVNVIGATYNLIGKNTEKLNLHIKNNKEILRKNKIIRSKLETVYLKDIGNIIMNYYAMNWDKKLNKKIDK